MNSPVIFTIVTRNYLAYARALTESFLAQHPGGKVFVLLVDEIEDSFHPAQERFATVLAKEIGIPDFERMAFRYTVLELCTAVKPFFIEHLFKEFVLEKLCYFDPDIFFYHPIDEILALLGQHSVVLTPHLTGFLEDQCLPNELTILRSGTYNLGFIGLSRHPGLESLLHWWQRKLLKQCTVDFPQGIFVDQRWMDLAPALFSGVHVHRDPGCNVAYWNLSHRDIRFDGTSFKVNGSPLKFFHFSGFSYDDVELVSKHQDRFRLDDLAVAARLFWDYKDCLAKNGHEKFMRISYVYDFFDNGVKIPEEARRLWRKKDPDGLRWPDPFKSSGVDSFFSWLNDTSDSACETLPLLTPLTLEIYNNRPDLREAYPDVLGHHRQQFISWFVQNAREQCLLGEGFIRPIEEAYLALSLVVPPDLATLLWKKYRAQGCGSFINWLNETEIEADRSGPCLTRLAMEIYRQRCDLQQAFPSVFESDRAAFASWFARQGVLEHRLDFRLVRPVSDTMRRSGVGPFPSFHSPQWRRMSSLKRLLNRKLQSLILRDPTMVAKFLRWVRRSLINAGSRRLSNDVLRHGKPSRLRRSPGDFGLNVIGYLKAETGMGEGGRAILRALQEENFPVAYTCIENRDGARRGDSTIEGFPTGNPYCFNMCYANADQSEVVFRELGASFFTTKYNIGFWSWELSQLPKTHMDSFRFFDEIWTNSNFVLNAVAQRSPVPVVNVGLPVAHPNLEPRLLRSDLRLPDGRFIFLFVFDALSVIERKNPLGLVEAYRRAFGSDTKETILVIKASKLENYPEQHETLRRAMNSVSGILIDRYLSRKELNCLFNLCDAYISLHRSEGFGITLAEAMCLGKPVIATGYSGNLDFMTPSNSFLVDYSLVEIQEDYGPYRKGEVWAAPDIDHAANLMRRVLEERADAKAKGIRAAGDMLHFHSNKAVARRIINRLRTVHESWS